MYGRSVTKASAVVEVTFGDENREVIVNKQANTNEKITKCQRKVIYMRLSTRKPVSEDEELSKEITFKPKVLAG